MTAEEKLPEEVKDPKHDRRGIPMEVNYNKRPTLLQGAGHLIEKDGGTIQMVKGIDTEEKVDRMIFAGKAVG